MKKWFTFSLVVLATGAWAWPRSTTVARAGSAAAAQATAPVQIVSPGQRPAGKPGEKGATYYGIEAQATRLTTRFRDGYEAVTERSLVGGVTTTLRDRGGNQRARLQLNRIDSGHDLVHYEPANGTLLQAMSDPAAVKPTLDWATRQTYSLSKDGTDGLVWDAGVMRPKTAARRDVESDVDEVETTWANGLTAKMTRSVYSRREVSPGVFAQGPALVSELKQNGLYAGTSVWFERDKVFMYYVAGLMTTAVVITEADLKARYDGWPFKPDTTWMNLQLIATHHFKTQVAQQGFVARTCEPSKPSRVVQFFMPTVYANEPGCDYLSWLDGSMFRDCCDSHDRCYGKGGCTESTWWQWWKSWTCDVCNIGVVLCFTSRPAGELCRMRAAGC